MFYLRDLITFNFSTVIAAGGIPVVAAGNQGDDACSYTPSCSDYSIAVGSYNSDHDRSSFSNYGDCIEAWGPGSNILSSTYQDKTYGLSDGTSMASPIISGMIGQLLNLNPDENVTSFNEIKSLLSDDTYSFTINDCQSTQCNAYSIACDDLEDLEIIVEGDPECIHGILHDCGNGTLCSTGFVCCDLGCGECGGDGCSKRPGGESECCAKNINKKGKSCDVEEAPCVVNGNVTYSDSNAPHFQWFGLDILLENIYNMDEVMILYLAVAVTATAMTLCVCCIWWRLKKKTQYVKMQIPTGESDTSDEEDEELME